MTRKKRQQTTQKAKKACNNKHIIGLIFAVFLLVNVFLAGLFFTLNWLNIPDIRNVVHYQPLQTSYILDRKGAVIERIYIENRTVVPLAKIPPLLGKAFISAEDGKFFEHPGLDFFSVLRAAVNNMKSGRRGQGGSTITQQVAKSLLLTPEKTYLRKFKEAVLAWRIDTLLSKEDILYVYLNEIYLGAGAYGVEAASQAYFDKHVWNLSLAEMAVLAGLPQAPSKYSPLKHPERAAVRQKYVLNRMAADGYISAEQARAAYAEKLSFGGKSRRISQRQAGYYTSVVKLRAEEILGEPLTRAAVTIKTYLDTDMQLAAAAALNKGTRAAARRSGGAVPQGGLVSMAACLGKVRALAGGTDYIKSPFNRCTQARRPAGSVFKPLVYASALSDGLNPYSTVSDTPITIPGSRGKVWRPKNSSGTFHGQVTLTEALSHSYNIPAIRLLQKTGIKAVHQLAGKSGISSKLPPDLSLALGAVDVSPLEMTAAYEPYICQGSFVKPRFIESIKRGGKLIYSSSAKPARAISPRVAAEVKYMLKMTVKQGTGKKARGLAGESGGKTGTTNQNRDAWFIGFNRRLLTGVWIGHDQNTSLGRDEGGGSTAAPVWLDYMKRIGAK
ncbi:MAG: penicillin-binding protein [Deltaproteobacteria bacterium]|nr:MAG: penicillin-binding protein [Deltaproteobacteria bacterium]